MATTPRAKSSHATDGTEAATSGVARVQRARTIRTINEQLSGPVLDVYKGVLPKLQPLSYEEVLASPEVVDGCMMLFDKQRDLFRKLLVDAGQQPVSDDDAPLWCGRSINDIRLLVVRTTAKKYFRTHGDRFGDVKEHSERSDGPVNAGLLNRLFDLVSRLWQGKPLHPPPRPAPKKAKSGADVFYDAIAPYLRHRWQVPLIPYYAALPQSLIEELGEGLLSLRTPEDLESLLGVGRADFNTAQRMTGALSREMLDTDPRAARGLVHAGPKEYERLLNGLYDQMGPRLWKIFVDTALIDSLKTKSTADITEMASHLDRMGPETVDSIVGNLQRRQIAPFLRGADGIMNRDEFEAIFGSRGNPRLARIFAQKAAQVRADLDDPTDFEHRIRVIFQAWRSSPEHFAKSL